MKDVLRSTIFVNTIRDIKLLSNKLLNHYKDIIIEFDGTHYESPTKDSPYYGTVHVIVKLVDGSMEMACEIIMTHTMHKYKEQAHKIYSQTRDNDINDIRMKTKLDAMMKKRFDAGNNIKRYTNKQDYTKMKYKSFSNFMESLKETFTHQEVLKLTGVEFPHSSMEHKKNYKEMKRYNEFIANESAKNTDPTYAEMVDFLETQQHEEFDIACAIYWFATNYHNGQFSNLYKAITLSQYKPSRTEKGCELDAYDSLVQKYA